MIQPIAIRFAVYTLAIFGFTLALPQTLDEGDLAVFHEDGPIEWAQFLCLGLAAAALGVRAWTTPAFRELLWLLASLTAFAAIREMDAALDRIIPVLGWKVGYLVLVYPLVRVIGGRDAFRAQVGRFLNSPAFPVMWAGFIVAIPVSQLLGHGPLLRSLMGEDYKGQYKRMIEESGEMIGYMLLLAGAVECWFLVRDRVAGGAARPTADAG